MSTTISEIFLDSAYCRLLIIIGWYAVYFRDFCSQSIQYFVVEEPNPTKYSFLQKILMAAFARASFVTFVAQSVTAIFAVSRWIIFSTADTAIHNFISFLYMFSWLSLTLLSTHRATLLSLKSSPSSSKTPFNRFLLSCFASDYAFSKFSSSISFYLLIYVVLLASLGQIVSIYYASRSVGHILSAGSALVFAVMSLLIFPILESH